MEEEYPRHLEQSESAWLFSHAGTDHKETTVGPFGFARSDRFAEAGYQPDKCFKQPLLRDVSYWEKGSRNLQSCMRETDPNLAGTTGEWLALSAATDRRTLTCPVQCSLYRARINGMRLRWEQLWWKRSEVPDPGNIASFAKWAHLQESWRHFWPAWRSFCSHCLEGWWKHKIVTCKPLKSWAVCGFPHT